WININAVPLFKPDDSKPFQVYTTFNDITAKRQTDKANRQTEDALKESEAKFRSIFEQAAVGVARVNLRGNIIQMNRKLTQMLGYDEGSLEGVNVFEITTDEDSEIQKQFSAELIAGTRDSYSMEKRYFRKDGSIMWGRLTVSASRNNLGDIDFTIGVLEDISERKQLQETLQMSEARFRNIVENAGVGITIVDSEDHILEANQKYLDLVGFSVDELKQMTIAEFTYPEDAEKDRILFGEVMDGKRNDFQLEKRYIRKDGELIWVHLTLSVVRDSEGVINYIIGIVRDITDSKLASSTQKDVFKQVERQRQELSDFAHVISHDLNNNFIKLRLMLKELETEENRVSIDRIGKLLIEMSDLTKHSVKLADAGLSIGARVEVDLGEILRDIAETHVPSEIEFISGCSPVVRADETKLTQVFVNIIENAVVHGRPKKIEVSCEALEDGVNLTIANDGIQIPLEIRPKIFDYGFSSEEVRRGLGLGFVKKLIESHGWKITLRDSPETAFDIWIPTRDIHG
ncbi:MAG: PAS domain S-box protein, partial [Candidatus Thorarchaeota archaeon]